MNNLGEEVQLYRIANDITKEELAMLTHLEVSDIEAIENGNDDVTVSVFESIAMALRIEPQELIHW